MHVAMVGDTDRRHAKFGRTLGQIRNLRRTIEQRIVRMVMQLHKVVPVISHALHHTVWSGREIFIDTYYKALLLFLWVVVRR